MATLMKSPFAIAGVAVSTAVVLLLAGLLFANPPICPQGVTPEEVEASGCSVGANIGLGLIVLLAVAIAISGGIAAAVAARSNRIPPAPDQPRSTSQPPPPTT